jgi:hypothetical protein
MALPKISMMRILTKSEELAASATAAPEPTYSKCSSGLQNLENFKEKLQKLISVSRGSRLIKSGSRSNTHLTGGDVSEQVDVSRGFQIRVTFMRIRV